jgi:hypothetical protein
LAFWTSGNGGILLEQQPVQQRLEIGQDLAAAADEARGIGRRDVEQDAVVGGQLLDRGFEAEVFEELFKRGFGKG